MATNGTSGSKSAFDTSSTIPLWLDGKEVKTSTTFDVISPVDHQKLYSCSAASEDDVQAAIVSAKKAFKTWSKTKPAERRDIFLRAYEEFTKRRDELYAYSRTETGALESMFGFEYGVAADACKAVAGYMMSAIDGTVPTVQEEGKSAMMIQEPYGVVLGIAPWNAPYALGLRACLQPLAM